MAELILIQDPVVQPYVLFIDNAYLVWLLFMPHAVLHILPITPASKAFHELVVLSWRISDIWRSLETFLVVLLGEHSWH